MIPPSVSIQNPANPTLRERVRMYFARLWKWKAHGRTGCPHILFYRMHLIDTPWGNLLLHWIVNADPLPLGMHDHPWDFRSIILWNGYTEKFLPDWVNPESPWASDYAHYRYRGTGSYDSHPSTYIHALVSLRNKRPCLTLCWTSKRNRKWGFPQKGFVVPNQPEITE